MSSSPATIPGQIGRYGTISLLKRHRASSSSNNDSAGDVLTAFGIDTPNLTFGRDPSCGVRLYYADVGLVHCRITFEERKAFLGVLGDSGVRVDGCAVFPEGEERTVPLSNGSEFEIHGKRFRFSYPPKEMREALYASPVPRRAPRLSLIQSMQVFHPRPSPDPRENLRILKSPMKNAFKGTGGRGLSTPLRTALFAKYQYHSPAKAAVLVPQEEDEEVEEEDNIVLVDGNHPRVVEDDKDLVILEDVDVMPQQQPQPQPHVVVPSQPLLVAPQPQRQSQQAPRTPSKPRSQSLHRAVLIRSAQRAVLKAERDEREKEEEEMEEMEVLDAVAGLEQDDDQREDDRENGYEQEDEDVEMEDIQVPLAPASDSEEENEEERESRKQKRQQQKQKLGWRKSLERLWPFRSSSPSKEEEEEEEKEEEEAFASDEDDNRHENEGAHRTPQDSSSPVDDDDDEEEEEEEHPAPLPQQTPARPSRPLGAFMTPQLQSKPFPSSASDPTLTRTAARPQQPPLHAQRFSLGGLGPQRVPRAPEQVWKVRDIVVPPPTPGSGAIVGGNVKVGMGMTPSPRKKAIPVQGGIGEEERKAIQERRRSALRDAGGVGFVPGMGTGFGSPIKPLGWSPLKPSTSSSSNASTSVSSSSLSSSLFKTPGKGEKASGGEGGGEGGDEDSEDTRSLLEKMKETVEGMKRRRSMATPVTPMRTPPTSGGRSPSKSSTTATGVHAEKEQEKEEESFSLLRPGVLDSLRAGEDERVMDVDEPAPSVSEVEPPAPAVGEVQLGEQEGGEEELVMSRSRSKPSSNTQAQAQAQPSLKPPESALRAGRSCSRSPAVMDVDPVVEEPSARVEEEQEQEQEEAAVEIITKLRSRSKPKTPVRRTGRSASVLEDEEDVPAAEEQENVTKKPRLKSKLRTPARRSARAPVEVEEDELAMDVEAVPPQDEVQAEEEEEQQKARSKSKPKLKTPARRAARPQPEELDVLPPAPVPAPAAPKVCVRKAAAPTTTSEKDDEEEEAVVEAKAPIKRGRKPAVAAPAAAATRRIRKATVEPEEPIVAPAPVVKRGRKPAAAVSALKEDNNVDDAEAGAPAPLPAKRGVRRAASATAVEEPAVRRGRALKAGTTIPIPKARGAVENTTAEELEAEVEVEEKKPVAAIKGRKRAATMKQEASIVTAAPAKTPAVKAPARARKTPATAPAAVPVQVQEVDKENTHGKVRVSRTAGRTGKVKKEVEEDAQAVDDEEAVKEEVPRGRVMRAARTRTRT
ncbi:hypothetical protein H0H87_005154 [Tephrocybe sp. NHM501043]|nr:hypothetical protein H0H87_005154 [Tephrocybe sp. NHM501043]